MESVRLKNFRGFLDTGVVPIRPLTLLVGRNSSGKSSLLRFFPLLRQSVETSTDSPILWFGRLVDFGDVNKVRNVNRKDIPVSMEFEVQSSSWLTRGRGRTRYQSDGEDRFVRAGIELSAGQEAGRGAWVSRLTFEYLDATIGIDFDAKGSATSLTVNGVDLVGEINGKLRYAGRGAFLSGIIFDDETETTDPSIGALATHGFARERRPFVGEIEALIAPFYHHMTADDTPRITASRIPFTSRSEFLGAVTEVGNQQTFAERIGEAAESTIDRLYQLVAASLVPRLVSIVNEQVTEFAMSCVYLGPVRARALRYYRVQDLAVSEVDFQGENLAMFLRSMSDGEQASFSTFCESHFGFGVTTRKEGGSFGDSTS